jgi:hypothetical protein
MKDLEAEGAQKRNSGQSDLNLNMREKDEGDLFGIRAIEAGFFGGVAQSRPTSVNATPIPSRPTSPALTSGKPQTYIPSLTSQPPVYGTMNGNQKQLADTRSFSASTTSSHQGQFGAQSQSSHTPSNITIPSNAPKPSFYAPSMSSRTASPASDSRTHITTLASSDPSLVHSAQSQRDLLPLPALRLAPSSAELNGRLKHVPADVSAEVSSSAVPAEAQPLSSSKVTLRQRKAPPPNLNLASRGNLAAEPSPRSPMTPRTPKTPKLRTSPKQSLALPAQGTDSNRMSHVSTSTYYPESTYGDAESAAAKMYQDQAGRLTVVNARMSSAASMVGSIDGDHAEFPGKLTLPKLGGSRRQSSANDRHASTSTFADLEDYFSKQRKFFYWV